MTISQDQADSVQFLTFILLFHLQMYFPVRDFITKAPFYFRRQVTLVTNALRISWVKENNQRRKTKREEKIRRMKMQGNLNTESYNSDKYRTHYLEYTYTQSRTCISQKLVRMICLIYLVTKIRIKNRSVEKTQSKTVLPLRSNSR